MGSTCTLCISGKFIAEGDKCLAIPVVQCHHIELTPEEQVRGWPNVVNPVFYYDYHWAPLGEFVTGICAGYGGINPDNTLANRRAMSNFFVELVKKAPAVAKGENSCRSIFFDIESFIKEKAPAFYERMNTLQPFDQADLESLVFEELSAIWDYTWELAQDNRLFCGDSRRYPRPVLFSVISKAAFDYFRNPRWTDLANRSFYSHDPSARSPWQTKIQAIIKAKT